MTMMTAEMVICLDCAKLQNMLESSGFVARGFVSLLIYSKRTLI